jgi:hypothetical protein
MIFGKRLGKPAVEPSQTVIENAPGKVWMSSVLDNYDIGMKQGTREKFFGHPWNPAKLTIPTEPEEVYQASKRHRQGFALQRSEFPEAIAVWDEKRFKTVKDIFAAGPFYAVKGRLAETLSQFDLGEGGLIPFTIYKADLETPYPGEFFLLNFGCRQKTVLPEQSRNVVKFSVHHETGFQKWKVNGWSEEGDVVVLSAVLGGPDLWFDPAIYNKIFMSDRVVQALTEIGLKDVFRFQECRIGEDHA